MGRAEFISPHRVVAAVPRGLTTSHLIYPLSRVMFDSFFVANTTTRDDYAESLQWFSTAFNKEHRRLTTPRTPPFVFALRFCNPLTTLDTPQRFSLVHFDFPPFSRTSLYRLSGNSDAHSSTPSSDVH